MLKEVLGDQVYKQVTQTAADQGQSLDSVVLKPDAPSAAESAEEVVPQEVVATTTSSPAPPAPLPQDATQSPETMTFGGANIAPTVQTAAPTPVAAATAAPTTVAPASTMAAVQALSNQDLGQLAQEFKNEANGMDPNDPKYKQMMSISSMITQASSPLNQASTATVAAPAVAAAATTPFSAANSQLAPKEALSDGNKCPDDEEEYPASGGTCFKKCATLTGGTHPIRTSPFSCCAARPCSIANSQVHMNFCGGFDVAGDSENGGCPSSEGACLSNEELFDGVCYKKCSAFDATYYHRVAPNICCKTKGYRCLMPSNIKFSATFATGGGSGDSNAATPTGPHLPLKELTEQTQ